MVRALVADGAHVVVADIDVDAAQAVVDSLPGAGTGSVAGARAARLNVTDAAAVAALVEEVIGEHGGLDLMFANAGITWGGDTELLTLEQWNAIIDVNIRGVVHCVHAAYPHMIARGSGSLVLTSSMGGLSPAGLLTSYAMTKHAVVGLGMSLRAEAAGHGVGVTVVCPAAVDTPIGRVPTPSAIDTDGIDVDEATMAELLAVDAESWRAELPLIEGHYAGIGDTVPQALRDELQELERAFELHPLALEDVRNRDLDELRDVLADRVADLDESFRTFEADGKQRFLVNSIA